MFLISKSISFLLHSVFYIFFIFHLWQERVCSFCRYVTLLLGARGIKNLEIHKKLLDLTYNKIKQAIVSLVWGEFFQAVGTNIFIITNGPSAGKRVNDLDGDAYITTFKVNEDTSEFTLEINFNMKLNTCEGNLEIKLNEFWQKLYQNEMLFTAIGIEGCFILDFVFNMH